DLKHDCAFLKKFDARNKVWKDIDGRKSSKNKKAVRCNFLLHPKQLSSDSEGSSGLNSPKKFLSNTIIKNSSLDESSNNLTDNVKKKVPHSMLAETCRIINDEDGDFCVESSIGDGVLKSSEILQDTKNTVTNSNISVAHVRKLQKHRPGSVRFENFDKKFTNLVEKILKSLNSIRVMMEKGIPPPDGEEDCARRMKRLQEFSARFSRVYLYPLLRQMDELSTPDKMSSVVINQKILYAQQVIMQGLQAYYNHLPSSVGKCCSDKLRSLLDQTLYLCQLFGLLKKDGSSENNEFINAMRTQSELLLEALNTFDMKIIEKNRKSNDPNAGKKKTKPQNNKMKSKLSMYTVTAAFRKDNEWKKAVEALAKKKPPVEKPHIVNLPSKIKLFPKRSSTLFKITTPRRSPVREDDIRTMVEMESELPAPPNTGE
ncbi:uncharacterized protein BDFB_006132, partial [Asbolus verrucosus]